MVETTIEWMGANPALTWALFIAVICLLAWGRPNMND